MVRIKNASMPTIPNAPVKMVSRKLFAYVEKGLTHATMDAATWALGHILSTTKGGEVLLRYPQQLS